MSSSSSAAAAASSDPAPSTTSSAGGVFADELKRLTKQRSSASKISQALLSGQSSIVHADPHTLTSGLSYLKFHDDMLEIGDSHTLFCWSEYMQHAISRLIQVNLARQQQALIAHRASRTGTHARIDLVKLDKREQQTKAREVVVREQQRLDEIKRKRAETRKANKRKKRTEKKEKQSSTATIAEEDEEEKDEEDEEHEEKEVEAAPRKGTRTQPSRKKSKPNE